MRKSAKLGDLIIGHITKNQVNSAKTRGLQYEIAYRLDSWDTHNICVKFIGDNVDEIIRVLTPVAGEDPTVLHFTEAYNWIDDEGIFRKSWNEYNPNDREVSYYDMSLIDGKYWCFAPSYYEALSQIATCPILTFEEAEAIENRLLAS